MKNLILIIITYFFCFNAYSQISFKNGYFITNEGKKIECQIKDNNWSNTPSFFTYKLSENGEELNNNITTIKEFGIKNESKFIKTTVQIDQSNDDLRFLSTQRNPEFKKQEVFLEVLLEGEANLYFYKTNKFTRFFYKKNTADIEQLIFKRYYTRAQITKENIYYKQQLTNSLGCNKITDKDIKMVDYNKKKLTSFFLKYNNCKNPSSVKSIYKKKDRDAFNLSIRPGINNSSLFLTNNTLGLTATDVDFDNQTSFRLGLEAELILPFNIDNISVILEPTFQSYEATQQTENFIATVDYTSIEVPLGFRYSFHINDTSDLFLNVSFIVDFPNGSSNIQLETDDFNTSRDLDLKLSTSFATGIGYRYKNKFSTEFRLFTDRDIINDTSSLRITDYKTLSFIVGYSFF
ncbi:tRNA modification GTPase [uncultured Dokdonia sp.]|uniref:tRNA modification GTPase n=1 Tax=uncultured Dokdonia sp. TaxID=575653 RepID=UPI00260FEECD|nr:tRNA modification GTPase [uncultured Dokdonia sp.]